MKMLRAPGVYAPQGDTALLMESLDREDLRPGVRTLDLCTGTGILAVAAARRGADATAVDISGTSVATARVNARLHGCRVRVVRGDLAAPVADERFDLVTANPPYVPAASERAPARGRRRAWDAGPDGRLLLDRICRTAPDVLAPHGVLLLVQSSLSGVTDSLAALREAGLRARVAASGIQPFGPVMAARAAWFERQGLIPPGTRSEVLVVIRAVRETARVPVAGRDSHPVAAPGNPAAGAA
ncbi:HemK2/MTQ2 family protein methyltransferase [Streptomyces sp. NPDC053493]|uniref:HemK2/MTQ2 family protein methyltransferase n=1 Tax=Streptomyces sp. NPDC053493 TaxID=3365705 RepID=UPI0037D06CD8